MGHEKALVKPGSPGVDSSSPVEVEHSKTLDDLSGPEASSGADVERGRTGGGIGLHFDPFNKVENSHVSTPGLSLHKSSFRRALDDFFKGLCA